MPEVRREDSGNSGKGGGMITWYLVFSLGIACFFVGFYVGRRYQEAESRDKDD